MYDDAVVGAGVIGLAFAYQLAKRGRRVVVIEQSPRAQGASIRNFGMIWPIGQPLGERRDLAVASRRIWLEILAASGLWHERAGSLHLAYREDEAAVLEEYAELVAGCYPVELLTPGEVLARAPAVNPAGLRLGLYSPVEVCVDPRQVLHEWPRWLAAVLGVEFRMGERATAIDLPFLDVGRGRVRAQRVWICCGDDLQGLFPQTLQSLGLVRCKLQMMRSRPAVTGSRLGPMLAAGLTLRHYAAFESCPTIPRLRERIAQEIPELDALGIHVMVAQNGCGELTIGDSHEYGDAIEPFDRVAIDELILDYLRSCLIWPDLAIAARWHGIYVKHPSQVYVRARPAPGVVAATGFGGAGMTLSMGAAARIVAEELGEQAA